MTRNEYNNYRVAVENFLAANRVKTGCYGPKHQEPEPGFEPYFSWKRCECCESNKGGDREDYTFAVVNGETFEAAICTDCVYFLAYGELDDETMDSLDEKD